jgi:hypothetical protein
MAPHACYAYRSDERTAEHARDGGARRNNDLVRFPGWIALLSKCDRTERVTDNVDDLNSKVLGNYVVDVDIGNFSPEPLLPF